LVFAISLDNMLDAPRQQQYHYEYPHACCQQQEAVRSIEGCGDDSKKAAAAKGVAQCAPSCAHATLSIVGLSLLE
jgi:hypothetical protein